MKTLTRRALLTVMALLFGSLFYFTACEAPVNPVSADGESYNLYDGLEEVEGTPTVTIHQGEAVGRDAWFEFTIENTNSPLLSPGVYDGWCMEWTKPIAQQGGVHENLRMYSTRGQQRWKPLNYFLNIKDELKSEDPSLTFREFQAVMWSVTPGPSFDLESLSAEELPSRLRSDGQPNFDMEKVKAIVATVKANANSFDQEGKKFAMFMQTGQDEQDVMVPVQPPISHGFVEGVTPSDDRQFAERTYPVIQADWEGPGGDKRWLGRNLGATDAPVSFDDDNLDHAGWFFTFNRSQGYYFDSEVPSDPVPDNFLTGPNSEIDWEIDNDPCREALKGNWRVPTEEEWKAVRDHAGAALNVHLAGEVSNQQGVITPPSRFAGIIGAYWSSTVVDKTVRPNSSFAAFPTDPAPGAIGSVSMTFQNYGHTIRCIEG